MTHIIPTQTDLIPTQVDSNKVLRIRLVLLENLIYKKKHSHTY